MAELTYREAVCKALADELRSDPDVIFFGEDVGEAGGVFKVTPGLYEEFGPNRVRDTPISEQAILGSALGAAITGLRPIAELMFADFIPVAMDQIVSNASKIHYMFGGQVPVPMVIRMPGGAGHQLSAQHSHSLEAMFTHVPGLKVVVPATRASRW